MKLHLAIIHMDMVVETLELEPGFYTLGRSQESNIVVRHFSLHGNHGEVFHENGQWFYRDHDSGRALRITNKDAIPLSSEISIATSEYVENEKTKVPDFTDVFKRHKSKLKYRISIVSGLVACLILVSVGIYQIIKKDSYPMNANNLLNQVRGKIVEFEVNRNDQAIQEIKDYAGLKDSDFKETSGFCTGFLIDVNVVLTASHCLFGSMVVDLSNDFYLRTSDNKKHKVKRVLGFDIKRDFLFLETEGMESYGSLEFATDYKIEQKIYTVGNVHGEGIAIRDGIISSETTDLNDPDVKFIRYSAGTSPGNSGGPLVDEHGRVVALVFAATWTENFNLGTPAEDLKIGFDKFVTQRESKKATIAMKRLLNFNAQAMLQSLSLPYLAQFDEYPGIAEKFNEIVVDIDVPVDLEKIDEDVLKKINDELIKTYNEVQSILKEKNEIILDWKSFVSEKTPAILPSQFDFSQSTFMKKNNRYYPKIAGFIDSPSKGDMTKYITQFEKEKKFDFQAYGYNIYTEEKSVGLMEGDVFYKPKNTTGSKLRLQDLSLGAPYSQMIVRNQYDFSSKEGGLDMALFLKNFVEPHGVLANSASRFIRPNSIKDFIINDFNLNKKIETIEVKDLQGRIWKRSYIKLFSSTHIFNYCIDMPEGPLCIGRIFNVYNDYLLGIIEDNFRKFVLSHLLINPYFWSKESLLNYIGEKKAEAHNLMNGVHLSQSGSVLKGKLNGFPFSFEIPDHKKIESIRLQTGLVNRPDGVMWTGYGLEWVQRETSGKDLLCGLGLEVFKSQSNFILNYLRDRKKQEKLNKIKGEDPKPLPRLWYRPFRGLTVPFQAYGYCAPLEEDPRVDDQYFVDFKSAKPFRYQYKVDK